LQGQIVDLVAHHDSVGKGVVNAVTAKLLATWQVASLVLNAPQWCCRLCITQEHCLFNGPATPCNTCDLFILIDGKLYNEQKLFAPF
jgi:hypothetical protein